MDQPDRTPPAPARGKLGAPQRAVRRAWHFVKRDMWRIRARRLSRGRSFLLRLLRVIVLAARGFRDDKCQLRASALTFYSLLSIVPVVAMAFGIAQGFKLEEPLDRWLRDALSSHQQVYEYVTAFSKNVLENTRGSVIAGLGLALLLYTVIKVLSQIENSFNDIWGIKRPRPLTRKLADYLMAMWMAPLLFILSSSAAVLARREVQELFARSETVGRYFGPVANVLLLVLPWVTTWVMFAFFYVFMPNTKVRLGSALMAGVVAGSVYRVVQWGYITFQLGVANYGAVYGSFAALPLFLVWLQLSWLVLLFGAELSFSWQNVDTYEFEHDCLNVSRRFRQLMALAVTQLLIRAFDREEPALTAAEISHRLEMPVRMVNDLLYELTAAGIVSETRADGGGESGYQAARPLERYTVRYVLDALERRGSEDIPVAENVEIEKLRGSLAALSQAMERSEANLLLRDV